VKPCLIRRWSVVEDTFIPGWWVPPKEVMWTFTEWGARRLVSLMNEIVCSESDGDDDHFGYQRRMK